MKAKSQSSYIDLVWSPDNKNVAVNVGSGDRKDVIGAVYIAHADGSHLIQVPLPESGAFNSVNTIWAPDGQHLLISTNTAQSEYNLNWYVLAADGSQLTALSPDATHQTSYQVIWSPNSQYLALAGSSSSSASPSSGGKPGLSIMELKTGMITTLSSEPVYGVSWGR